MTALVRFCIAILLSMLAVVGTALAQDRGLEIRAVAIVAPPFVVKQRDQLSGFSIELWNAVATRLQLRTTYQMPADVSSMVASVRSKSSEVMAALLDEKTDAILAKWPFASISRST